MRLEQLEKDLQEVNKVYYDISRNLLCKGKLKIRFAASSKSSTKSLYWNATNFFTTNLSTIQAQALVGDEEVSEAKSKLVTAELKVSNTSSSLSDLFICRTEKQHHLMKGVSIKLTYKDKSVFLQFNGNTSYDVSSKIKLLNFLVPALGEFREERLRIANTVPPPRSLPEDTPLRLQRLFQGQIRSYYVGNSSRCKRRVIYAQSIHLVVCTSE